MAFLSAGAYRPPDDQRHRRRSREQPV